jgi:hypothetical protein
MDPDVSKQRSVLIFRNVGISTFENNETILPQNVGIRLLIDAASYPGTTKRYIEFFFVSSYSKRCEF